MAEKDACCDFKKTKKQGHHAFKPFFVTTTYSKEYTLSLSQCLMFFNA